MKIRIKQSLVQDPTPDSYVLEDKGLIRAIEVAIALNQPLLLTGEPGTGKTRLAYKLADYLHKEDTQFLPTPLVFNTKTNSSARDLFYVYDAVGHFQSANIKREDGSTLAKTGDYIELMAYGRAIVQTKPQDINRDLFSIPSENPLAKEARSSVVLIDEIDKAPRDFPNDILNEIENREFYIKEQRNEHIVAHREQQILVIMTSNSEKNLPEAFLRRCVFYHIPFPDNAQLKNIIKANLPQIPTNGSAKILDELIDFFKQVRKETIRKKPATAELINWVRFLESEGIFIEKKEEQKRQHLRDNLSILVKTKEDQDAVQKLLQRLKLNK